MAKGCTNSDCPQALLAGLDIYMVPEDWKALHASLVRQVKDGTIPMARLDEAVLRVLKLKQALGIFDGEVKPSQRAYGGKWELMGSAQHRALAREAVAKSQVLLKNAGVLPLKPGAVIVDIAAGRGAAGPHGAPGGNCPLTQADQVITTDNGVRIVGHTNLAAMVGADASALYARNVLDF